MSETDRARAAEAVAAEPMIFPIPAA
jgi:hypothetical protein